MTSILVVVHVETEDGKRYWKSVNAVKVLKGLKVRWAIFLEVPTAEERKVVEDAIVPLDERATSSNCIFNAWETTGDQPQMEIKVTRTCIRKIDGVVVQREESRRG